jgi:hypothetical protein
MANHEVPAMGCKSSGLVDIQRSPFVVVFKGKLFSPASDANTVGRQCSAKTDIKIVNMEGTFLNMDSPILNLKLGNPLCLVVAKRSCLSGEA